MSEVSPELHALVERARDGCDPDEGDRERLGRAISARIGGGIALVSAAGASAVGASTAGASTGLGMVLVKALAAVTFVGGVTTAITVTESWTVEPTSVRQVSRGVGPARTPVREMPLPVVVSRQFPIASSRTEASLPTVTVGHNHDPVLAPIAARRLAVTVAAEPLPIATEPIIEPDAAAIDLRPVTTLPEELRLIRRAHDALSHGDANAALAVINQHAEQFRLGTLGVEREGLRILALCALDRTNEADSARAAFLSAHGRAPFAPRVREACRDVPIP